MSEPKKSNTTHSSWFWQRWTGARDYNRSGWLGKFLRWLHERRCQGC